MGPMRYCHSHLDFFNIQNYWKPLGGHLSVICGLISQFAKQLSLKKLTEHHKTNRIREDDY